MALTFLVGGARSGKSSLAVRLARDSGSAVTVIATGTASDDEMAERIRLHQEERPDDWALVEERVDLMAALAGVDDDSAVLVDCLTLWVSNLMVDGVPDNEIIELARMTAKAAAARSGLTIVVSNEVGSGIVPMEQLSRRFRDVLGAVNATWSRAASSAYLVVAGRTLVLDG